MTLTPDNFKKELKSLLKKYDAEIAIVDDSKGTYQPEYHMEAYLRSFYDEYGNIRDTSYFKLGLLIDGN